MRSRTFILIILVLIIGAVAAVLVIANLSDGGPLANGNGGEVTLPEPPAPDQEPGLPTPLPTPAVRLETVVIAKTDLPIGERIRRTLIDVEERPNTNIAIKGEYMFSDPEELIGRIVRVPISEGQAILSPMVALRPAGVAPSGSDLALYVEPGEVAVAFPIDQFSGIAYALRPGDLVDVMMTLQIVEMDPEFNTALPNTTRRVIDSELLAGRNFLFPETTQGRLEFITEINQVVEFVPGDSAISSQDFVPGAPIPKRVTQLTIQQAEVLWVGTWRDPRELEKAEGAIEGAPFTETEATGIGEGETEGAVAPEPTPVPERFENRPDVIILSMLTQDALVLKWALERGIDIDLALRSQGDVTIFVTTGVSLPQIVDQGGLAIPESADFDLYPRAEDVPIPSLPVEPLDQPPGG